MDQETFNKEIPDIKKRLSIMEQIMRAPADSEEFKRAITAFYELHN